MKNFLLLIILIVSIDSFASDTYELPDDIKAIAVELCSE